MKIGYLLGFGIPALVALYLLANLLTERNLLALGLLLAAILLVWLTVRVWRQDRAIRELREKVDRLLEEKG